MASPHKKNVLLHCALLLTLLVSTLVSPPALAADPKGRPLVLTASAWPPYFAPSLQNGGLITELVGEALQRRGYGLEIKWLPWARAVSMARQGSADGVLGAWHTEERTRDFHFSQPFMKNELVFFKRSGEDLPYRKLQDLKPYRIGVILDSGIHELLKADFAANLDIVASHDNNIKKLMKKRFDLMADEKEGIRYLLSTRYPQWQGAIEVLEPPLQVNALHMMISRQIKDHQQITEDFNLGLQQIISDGTFDALLEKHGFSGSH